MTEEEDEGQTKEILVSNLGLVAPKSGFHLPDPICAYDSAMVVEVVVV